MHVLASRLQKKQKNLVSNVASYFLMLLSSYLPLNMTLYGFVVNSPVDYVILLIYLGLSIYRALQIEDLGAVG